MLYEMERKKEYIKGILLSEKICRHVHVKGCYYDSYEKKHTNLRDCSGEVKIPLGVHGIITNSVREGGCNRARLYINSGKEKATQGVWSPDSTANSSYVVFK